MKRLFGVFVLILPVVLLAQNPRGMQGMQGMSQQQLQQMQQAAAKMQLCMRDVDQVEMELFRQKAMKMDQDIKALCGKGKRDQAMEVAMAFSKEVEKSPELKKMQECSKLMQGVMPAMSPAMQAEVEKSQKQHVCDN